MNMLIIAIWKELLQLRRNALLLLILVAGPVIILGLIPFSLDEQVSMRLVLVDEDQTPTSRMVGYRLKASPYVESVVQVPDQQTALERMRRNQSDIILLIPSGFEKNGRAPAIVPDGTHTLNAQSNLGYLIHILRDELATLPGAETELHLLFNPELEGRAWFLVSLLILLVTLIGVCLITIQLVSEKESGMWEQLQVTPLSLGVYLAARWMFFAALCLAEAGVGLLFCRWIYGFRLAGLLPDYLLLMTLFLWPMLSIGLCIASVARNQVQAVYMLVLVLLTLILMSSMFTFMNAMPAWAQALRFINPLYFMLDASRLIALKGFSMADTGRQAGMLVVLGTILWGTAHLRMVRSRYYQ
jgi:ABC-2 type transport system permease protein